MTDNAKTLDCPICGAAVEYLCHTVNINDEMDVCLECHAVRDSLRTELSNRLYETINQKNRKRLVKIAKTFFGGRL